MRKNLDPERRVTVPQPFPDLSARIVLTMQFFPGKPLRRVVAASEEAKLACEEVVHSACKQVFIDGLFHGDPHAGNLLINEQGTLCMIDLGMVGRLSQDQRDDLVTLIMAAVTGDSGTIARVLLKMGTPTQRVNILEMRAEIERIRTEFLLVGSLDEVDTSGFIEKFAAAAGKFRIKLAPEYVMLIKAAATIEGIIRNLHPDVDLLGITRPYAEQLIAARFSPQAMLQGAVGEVAGLGAMMKNLPTQIDQILHDAQAGNLQVRAMTPELDEIPAMIHSHASRLALTAFASSMTLGAALVFPPRRRGHGRAGAQRAGRHRRHGVVDRAVGLALRGARQAHEGDAVAQAVSPGLTLGRLAGGAVDHASAASSSTCRRADHSSSWRAAAAAPVGLPGSFSMRSRSAVTPRRRRLRTVPSGRSSTKARSGPLRSCQKRSSRMTCSSSGSPRSASARRALSVPACSKLLGPGERSSSDEMAKSSAWPRCRARK
jgi:hypothetical protein